MIKHLTQNQIEDYCRQRLRAPELLSVSDHLGECEACRRQLECAVNGDAAFFAVRSEVFGEPAELFSQHRVRPHPTAEQTAGFVDGNLAGDELQMVVDHLTNCERCAFTVEDLRAFRSQIAPSLDREYQPAAIPTESWWHRTAASVSELFGLSPRLAFGGALTVVVLAATGWLIWRTLPGREPKQEVVVAPPPTSQPAPEPPATQLVAQLKDGERQLTLDQEGKLSGADDLPAAYRNILKDALTNQRLETSPNLKGLARPPSSLMSGDKQGSDFFVIEPVGRVVLTDRPTFRWSPMEGATSYVVEVYNSEFGLVANSPELNASSWSVPQQLGRGGVYSWQVKAIKDGQEFNSPRPPAPQARFRILDQAKVNELANARRAYASSHLTLGLLYAEAGLLKEAERELRELQKANPDSAIARSLLRQVQTPQR